MSFQQILQMARRSRPLFVQILKWNRNQPRGAAGTPEGGRWVKGVSQGLRGEHARTRGTGLYEETPGMEKGGGRAGYSTLMNAPMGEGFHNRPRGVGLPERPKTPPTLRETPALTSGSVSDVKEKFDGGVNASYLVEMDDENHTKAVFKPEAGERWGHGFANSDIEDYITNTDFSLAEREAMASEVSFGLGFGELVPETHHRTEIHAEGIDFEASDEDSGGYDSAYAREQYDEYREKAQEAAIDAVGEEMYGLYQEEQKEHVTDIENRVEEVQEIWDEEMAAFVDPDAHGSRTAMAEHPVLPLGSKEPFERLEDAGTIDPIEFLDEAGVDVTSRMSEKEKEKVTELIRAKLKEGYTGFDEVDEDKAKEHLEYDDWRENHEMTEDRLYQSKIQTFTEWRKSQGYESSQGGGGGPINSEAPHPTGGSLQRFVEDLDNYGDLTHEDATKFAVLDYVLGTMDRHGGNLMFSGDKPVAIDNGYSMPASRNGPDNFTFRSKAVAEWLSESRHHKVPPHVSEPVVEALNATDWEAMVKRHPSMNKQEREAFLGRVEKMKEALSYPEGLSSLWHDQKLMRN